MTPNDDPGTARVRAPEIRREQLLDAAEDLLTNKGLAGLTVSAVAANAGLAKGTTYLYFDSKDQILASLRSRYLDRFVDALGTSASGTPTERLERLIRQLFEFAEANHSLHHALFHEAGMGEGEAFDSVAAVVAELVHAACSRAAGDIDVAAATTFVVHGVHALLVEGMHSESSSEIYASAAARLATATIEGLRA